MITVIAVDGALGEIIVDILNANNVDAVFASSPAVHITNKIVFVTFEFDGYPFVMTNDGLHIMKKHLMIGNNIGWAE